MGIRSSTVPVIADDDDDDNENNDDDDDDDDQYWAPSNLPTQEDTRRPMLPVVVLPLVLLLPLLLDVDLSSFSSTATSSTSSTFSSSVCSGRGCDDDYTSTSTAISPVLSAVVCRVADTCHDATTRPTTLTFLKPYESRTAKTSNFITKT